ncbi:DNA-binding LacI/PurR family transcriptional regulator [Microbacterium halimionae]|uniref:DNA-binding LacI/PurR family transcriptional regulator n=1 Tax=Microbacterium halimionae TaxID=1526413 RepID=A0A7W3PKA9_9MICO|nr:LacI family DNA-binding transcriptional regulator [Microbacterium halimionae]MBA8815325.1 DNA-binding LacI/PurR family transcriptional regulator [Microbacterium halimionae]NII93884.1 DNA-binding LacI/PurR family transcriptional regulator [Microbacterium halimionae]
MARVAGVSRSTASYALSGKRTISPEVRLKVAEAVASLGYTPNAGARALATSQTKVIALLAQFLDDEFAPAMLQYILGVTNTARQLGYDTLLVSEGDGAAALQRISSSRMVDGFVLLNVAQDDERLGVLQSASQPGALVGLPGETGDFDIFDLDFVATGRLMVERMSELGHRELILVSQPEHVVERGGAYVWRLANAASERAEELGVTLHHYFGSASQPEIGRDLNAFLDAHPDATGLLLNNEAAAAALPNVLNMRGISSPGDLSVIGRYSDDFARTFSLPYSAIDSAADELGRRAVEHLVARIEAAADLAVEPLIELIPPTIQDRGSTAAPQPR